MSYVTDVTVILTNWQECRRFEGLVEQHEGFEPQRVMPGGPNCTGCTVYALGLDYAKPELIEALLAGPWSRGSVVSVCAESWDRAQVKVFGAVPAGGWSSGPEIVS